jgi:hypothetical protein
MHSFPKKWLYLVVVDKNVVIKCLLDSVTLTKKNGMYPSEINISYWVVVKIRGHYK